MDPHFLRTFVTVARCGSFSEAARELGYTQSAVSQHIAALESELGTAILERRPVAPTSVGARLLEHAAPLLLRLDAARADMARLTAAPVSRVTVGVSPLALSPDFTRRLTEVCQASPTLEITVRALSSQAIPAEVAKGTVDLGVVDGMAAPNDPLNLPDIAPLTTAPVSERPIAVVLPTMHPLAGRASLCLSDLIDARWIDAPEIAVPLVQLRTVTESDGYRPFLRYEGTDVQGLIALAGAGYGLVLLPHAAVNRFPEVTAVPICEPRLVHRIELLHSRILDGCAKQLATALAADGASLTEDSNHPMHLNENSQR
ncbi:LysR family transcriptional regulator [Streptomyces sp. NPDC016566]|uniref:LysR family transcriptional regulator n=1 Tax=Streptomyces sp. NPDC016566 TaxID=3364967 RepID=UPI0037020CC7